MKQSINAAKVIQGKWKRHRIYEQLQQILINQRYKRQSEKPFRLLNYLEAKLGAKEFNRRVKKLNDEYQRLHKDHFNEPNIAKTEQLNKNRELEQKAFVIFTPQNLTDYYATLAQARKKFQEQNEVNIDGLSDELMKSKVIERQNRLEKKQVYKHQQTLDEYHYSYTRPSADNSYKTLPNTVVRDKQTNDYFKQKAVDLLSDYQDTNHEDSATLKVALYSFLIVVYRLLLGTKMDKICQHFNKEGITRNVECDYKICCKRLNKANKQLIEQYNGLNYVTDLEKQQQMFKLNVITYMCDDKVMKTRQNQPEQFSKFEELIIDKDFQTVNVLLVPLSIVDEVHAMYISDIDKIINEKLCPRNCQKIFNPKNQHYQRDLARHLKYCQGPETIKQVKLDHLPKPYYPHVSNNKLFQKLIATGQQDQLTPTLNYIIFDFETVENIINFDNVIAQLDPLSVASAATINDQITMLYFDLRNGTDFIEQWISQLFEVAIKVNEANQSNIPDVTIDDKHYEPYKPQAKQTIVSHQDYDFDLRFIDILSFIPSNNTLKQFVEKFGTKVLGQTTSFTKEDFYDKLNNKNIGDQDYEQYVNHSVNFENRWEYLKHYNIRYVTWGVTSYFKFTCNSSKQKVRDVIMSNDSYELWFLIDYCNLIIDGIDLIALFDKHLGFESFACTMMSKIQDAINQHNDSKSLYYKQILNSAFGGEGLNNTKFDKISFNNARYASIKQLNQCHKATRKLSDDIYNSDGEVIEEAQYMVSESPRQFKCNKPLQEVIFTLDNSKVHFCNMDTDSMYLAIAGSQIEEKKLMGITTESQGENIVCLAPKCYSLYN
ncbi:MAG: hypothetical protein EZS28_018750 [Streblomastix strix]|uniref:Uncharacterized protein n=1 Tax=Streblomastix strix TaxID=222440 RepID=A0A5J4VT19_9EUKA|nr:MAG: hypothetical protein EZS28_018750 [Streblomastix strix]